MLTVGVEEEFLLLEPGGAVAPLAREVTRLAGQGDAIKQEFMAYQVETATPVCARLDELRTNLIRLRTLAGGSAERAGVRLVAAGTPPYRTGAVDQVSAELRYRDLARRFPHAIAAGGSCACQVHVGVADRNLRVEVLARLRPWLAPLLSIATNSPISGGADTGWNSHRYRSMLHWPTFRPPGPWTSAARYDRVVRALIAGGVAIDPGAVYFLARLSPRYPTIEVRVADTCLAVEDSVLLAGVVRGLVATLIDDVWQGRPVDALTSARINAHLLTAARHGVTDRRTEPRPGRPSTLDAWRARLLDKIGPALRMLGDLDEVEAGLARIHQGGTGADRQRQLFARAACPEEFVASLAESTLPAVPAR